MKRLILLLIPSIILASCGGGNTDKATELNKLKKERADLDTKIKALENGKTDTAGGKVTPVSVTEVKTQPFTGFVEVHSVISGDANVLVVPQAMGTVKSISVRLGQRVSKGQVLAVLDATTLQQQIESIMPQLNLQRSLYEKQQNLWKQNIGTEVQLMSAKTQYEATQKQIATLKSQMDMYRIVSPINGTIDAINLKVGDYASPQGAAANMGIRVVSYDKLKAEAELGENYLGKVKQGDPVILALPDVNDTINTRLSYVSQAVNPQSRAFTVQVQLKPSSKLHPNMSCIMKIANYTNHNAIAVPVSLIQKTSEGEMLYIAEGNKAKSVKVTTGRVSNGEVEILSGLKPGDKVITTGYEAMEEGQKLSFQ